MRPRTSPFLRVTILVALFSPGLPSSPARAASPQHDRGLHAATGQWISRADSLRKAGQGEAGAALLATAANEAARKGDRHHETELMTARGRLLVSLGKGVDAERVLTRALATAEALRDTSLICEAQYQLCFAVDAQGRPPRAIPLMESLIRTATAAGDSAYVMRADILLARRQNAAGAFDDAIARFQRAGRYADRMGKVTDGMNALLLLGVAQMGKGEIAQARATWLEATRRAQTIGNVTNEATALSNLGSLELHFGDPGRAVDHLTRARALHLQQGNARHAFPSGGNAAEALIGLGRFDEAEGLFREQLAIAQREGYRDYEATQFAGLAGIAYARGRYHESARAYRLAHGIATSLGLVEREASTLRGLARALAAMDSLGQAIRTLEGGADHLRARAPRLEALWFEVELGALLVRSGAHARAVPILRSAMRGARAIGSTRMQVEGLPTLAEAFEATGEPDSARAALVEAVAAWEAERSTPSDPEWREQRGAAGGRAFTGLARRILAEGRDAEHVRDAFDLLQRYKARTLLERIAHPAPGRQLETIEPVSLAMLQESVLEKGELLLDVYVGAGGSFLFAVSRGACEVFDLPADIDVSRQILAYWHLLATPPRGTVRNGEAADGVAAARAAGAEISAWLLAPIETRLAPATRVLFVPDGVFNVLPLGSLPAPDASARVPRALTNRTEVCHLPSASALRLAREARAEKSGAARVLALAGAGAGPRDDLAGAEQEVRSIASAFRDVHVLVASERAESLSVDAFARYDVLHLAAHTALDDQQPWRSAIALLGASADSSLRGDSSFAATRGQSLTAADIASMHLPARLVVLSGCESAGGRVVSGEGVLGLTGAFLSAGVPVVVATLWPVDDRVTQRLMKAFYRHLGKGEPVAAALRQAQSELAQSRETALPFYWGAFVVVGDGSVLAGLEPKSTLGLPAIAGVGLLVVIALLYVGRRRRAGRQAFDKSRPGE